MFRIEIEGILLSTESRLCDPRRWKQGMMAASLYVPKTIQGGSTLAVCSHFPPKLHVIMLSPSVDIAILQGSFHFCTCLIFLFV